MSDSQVSRRQFVGGAAALGGGIALPMAGVGMARPQQALDLSVPQDFLTAIVKMRGGTTPTLNMGFVIGGYYGVVDDRATPLFGVLAGTFTQYHPVDDLSYRIKALEVAYFTDLDTGELLETWDNPYTGETVTVPQTRMGPSTTLITPAGLKIERASGEAVNMQLSHRFRPAITVGDQVWVTEEIQAVAAPPGRKAFVYNEMSTYQGNRKDLEDPDQASVRSNVEFHSIISWRPWMKMGDHPGHLTGRASGQHVKSFDELPAYYQELTRKHHPDVAADALELLQA